MSVFWAIETWWIAGYDHPYETFITEFNSMFNCHRLFIPSYILLRRPEFISDFFFFFTEAQGSRNGLKEINTHKICDFLVLFYKKKKSPFLI